MGSDHVLVQALQALVAFKEEFGRELTPAIVGELHAARVLGAQLTSTSTTPGFDLVGSDGVRYQVKQRAPATLNVDLNNFDFDVLVLVNVNGRYELAGLWLLGVDDAKNLFVWRDRFRKYQARQDALKVAARRVR